MQLRILTHLLDWRRCSSSQSCSFSVISSVSFVPSRIRSKFSEGALTRFCFCTCAHKPFTLFEISSIFLLAVHAKVTLLLSLKIDHFGKSFPSLGLAATFTLSRLSMDIICNLRDWKHAVLNVSSVVSIFNCRRSAKRQRNWSISMRAAVFPHETSVICSVVRFITINTVC